MGPEIHGEEATQRWLLSGLGLTRLRAPSAGELAVVAPWVLAALGEVAAMPPPGVVADVGHLLGGGRPVLAPSLVPASASRLRAALRAYEDAWIGGLALDGRVDAAADAVAGLPAPLRPRAVALVVDDVLTRIGFSAGATVNVPAARRLLSAPPPTWAARVPEALGRAGEAQDQLAEGYEGLVRAARAAPRLLDEALVFALEHLTVLGSAAQRLAASQVLEVAAELGSALPRRAPRRGPGSGATPTRIDDEGAYPAGGFASLSRTGNPEHLIASEVVYLEDGPDVDLFDVRYAEGELLSYARDEAVHVRPRREIVFLLDPSLAALRFKDPGLRWQRLVVVLGLLVCATRRLIGWLHEDDLTVRLLFVREPNQALALGPERELTALLLREAIERGVVEVGEGTSDEVGALVARASRRARVAVVQVGAGVLGRAWGQDVRAVELAPASLASSWEAWVQATWGVLEGVL